MKELWTMYLDSDKCLCGLESWSPYLSRSGSKLCPLETHCPVTSVGLNDGGKIQILAPEHSSFCCILMKREWSQVLANEILGGWCRWPVFSHYYGVHLSVESRASDRNGIEGHLGQNICSIPLGGQVSKLCNAAEAAESE